MNRRVRRGLAVVCFLAAGWVVTPLVAGADEPVETGWWSRENGGNPVGPPVTVPRPPDVPEGGLLVAAGGPPSEPTAISALRFSATVATRSTLTLRATAGRPAALVAPVVLACMQGSGWGATDHGEWFLAPDADCDAGQVVGEFDADGNITWELPPQFKNPNRNFIEVILVPGPDSPPFRMAWDPPSADALTAPVDVSAPTTTTAPPPAPALPFDPFATPEPEAQPADRQFGGPQFVAGSAPSTTPTTAPPAQATPPPQDEVASGPVTPISAADTTNERIMAAVLLGLLAIGLWLSVHDRDAVTGLLARVPVVGRGARDATPEMPDERMGGVGRFSRPRDDLPTRF